MICVPLLEKFLSLPKKCAHATALVVIFPISFVSALVYCLNGHLEAVSFLVICGGVVFGGICGAFLLKILPEKIVKILFVLLMFVGGVRLLFWWRCCAIFFLCFIRNFFWHFWRNGDGWWNHSYTYSYHFFVFWTKTFSRHKFAFIFGDVTCFNVHSL